MKNIKKSIKFATIVAALGMGVSSCSLDLLPLNEVVLENYWTDKSDVESVVASCYSKLNSGKYIHNILVWGEGRSDNTIEGPDCPEPLKALMKGSIKTTNDYCDWKEFYEVINRCNTVLEYAPKVAEKDPNYTLSDLRINMAECKALRAMSYFYLIKTFGDVPYVTSPTIDDDLATINVGQTSCDSILNSCIADLEECQYDAQERYLDYELCVSRITRPAIWSLLSEMCLWKASDSNLDIVAQSEYYAKAYKYADLVIESKKKLYLENNIDGVNLTDLIDKNVYQAYGYPLLGEIVSHVSTPAAFRQIFCEGFSFESIFENASHYNGVNVINNDFAQIYGADDDKNTEKTFMLADGELMSDLPSGTSFNLSLFPTATDMRTITSFSWEDGSSFEINKYCNKSISTTYDGKSAINYKSSGVVPTHSAPSNKNAYHNYLFYRLTEVMLLQAEAEIEYAKILEKLGSASAATPVQSEGSTEGTVTEEEKVKDDVLGDKTIDEMKAHALKLVCAVYLRSNPYANSVKDALPSASKLATLDDYEQCIMKERQRELLFEGKRYYDLVRMARRDGNTRKFVTYMTHKYANGGASVAIKMKKMDFLYMPILKKQIQVNPKLKQNGAYLDEETIENN